MQAETGTPLSSRADAGERGRGRIVRPALAVVVVVVGSLVWGLDRATKAWALAELVPGQTRDLLGSFLRLHLLFNPGAAFSLGTGVTPLFTLVQAAVSVAVLVAATRVASPLWALVLGLVLGGASGNLTDRLTRPPGFARGHVVDFLALPHWPVFNVADSAICVAAALVAIAALRGTPFGPPDGSGPAGPGATPGDAPLDTPVDAEADDADAPDDGAREAR